jgi:lipocalin
MKKIFFMAILATVFCSCEPTTTVNNAPVKEIDLKRYIGDWYEIARIDHAFERGLDYVMAHYELRKDGNIDVLNTGIKNGRAEDAKGMAKITNIPGLLRVSFFGPFFSDYRILMIDKDYQYALVGGSDHRYLWILSRTPQLDDATRALILANAESRGYDTTRLLWVKQWEK